METRVYPRSLSRSRDFSKSAQLAQTTSRQPFQALARASCMYITVLTNLSEIESSDSGICKNGKIFIHRFAQKKMVQQSDVLKRFLADTYSNQILHLNSVSESKKTEDFNNFGFPKNRIIILQGISL